MKERGILRGELGDEVEVNDLRCSPLLSLMTQGVLRSQELTQYMSHELWPHAIDE